MTMGFSVLKKSDVYFIDQYVYMHNNSQFIGNTKLLLSDFLLEYYVYLKVMERKKKNRRKVKK